MSKEDDPRPDLTPRDVTILRPRPGVSRRPATQPSGGAAPSQAPAGSDTTARDGAAREPARDAPAGLAGSAYGQNAPISDPAAGYGAPPAYSPAHVSGGAHADARGAAEAAPLGEWLATGTNPLLQAAVPLLVLTGRLREPAPSGHSGDPRIRRTCASRRSAGGGHSRREVRPVHGDR